MSLIDNPSDTSELRARVVPFQVSVHRIDADAAKVVKRLVRAGHTAYLVGGCVRDLLLNRTPKDFDVATSARPNEVRGLFRNCRIIGRRFRLAHVLFGRDKVVEVATFRKDPALTVEAPDAWEEGEPDPESAPRITSKKDRDDEDLLIRHDNVFGTPSEDAVRRDFTMNALFLDLERREVIDYVGGLNDLERRVIRTIGDADVRFREDPVRILRAVKFAARLDLAIEPDVYDAIVVHRDDLMRAARPRLLEEVLRLCRGGASRRSLWLAHDMGVLAVVLPELAAWIDDDPHGAPRFWRRLAALDEHVLRDRAPGDAVLLSTLLYDPALEAMDGTRDVVGAVTEFLEGLLARLAIPRRLFDRVRTLLAVQRRVRMGRIGTMNKREWWPEALQVSHFEALARGEVEPEPRLPPSPRYAEDRLDAERLA
ncbi:MAG: polynucleotide adenylyltransferase PcnB [Polyangiales bacterium]